MCKTTAPQSVSLFVCSDVFRSHRSLSAEIQVSLERSHNELASQIDRTLRESHDATVARLGAVLELSNRAMISHMNQRFKALEHTGIPASAVSSEQLEDLSIMGQLVASQPKHVVRSQAYPIMAPLRLSSCDPACICQCHTPSRYAWAANVTALKPILGSLAVFCRGNFTKVCTIPTCNNFHRTRRPTRDVRVVYQLPNWLIRASLSIFYATNLHGNPQMVIRVVNRLPNSAIHPQSIYCLALNGDIEGVKNLLTTGAASLYDVAGPYAVTPLMVSLGNPELTRLLLAAGADPYQEGVTRGVIATVVNRFIRGRPSDLEICAEFPMSSYLEELEFTPLQKILMGTLHIPLATALSQPSYLATINTRSLNGQSPLEIAVLRENLAAVQQLLRCGADATACDTSGERLTALHWACMLNNLPIATALLNAGASATARDVDGLCPVHWAAGSMTPASSPLPSTSTQAQAQTQTSSSLPDPPSQSPPNPDEPDPETALLSLLLLTHKGDPNSTDNYGSRPLNSSTEPGFLPRTRFLLDHGAEINHRDQEGETALSHAIGNFQPRMAALLLDAGIDVTNTNNAGQGVLHNLACQGDLETIMVFRERVALLRWDMAPATMTARDKSGKTPLQLFNERSPGPPEELRQAFEGLLEDLLAKEFGFAADEEKNEESRGGLAVDQGKDMPVVGGRDATAQEDEGEDAYADGGVNIDIDKTTSRGWKEEANETKHGTEAGQDGHDDSLALVDDTGSITFCLDETEDQSEDEFLDAHETLEAGVSKESAITVVQIVTA